jgi:preprotein translocase subunit SecB
MSEPQQPGQVLSIEKVYVKDCSIEVPNAPQIFFEEVQPQIDVQMQTATGQVGDGLYECVLTITVTAKAADRTVFLVEAAQSGIFQIRGFAQNDLDLIQGIGCPTDQSGSHQLRGALCTAIAGTESRGPENRNRALAR